MLKQMETTKRTLSETKQLRAYESLYLFLWHAKSTRKQPFPVSSSFESLRKDIFYCKKNTFRFSLNVLFDDITLLNRIYEQFSKKTHISIRFALTYWMCVS